MSDCCTETQNQTQSHTERFCPKNGNKGKSVQIITLKSLLKPEALKQLNPEANYRFCSISDCSVVYYSEEGQTFDIEDLKVPVFQKNSDETVPVCYCFGWTRQRISKEGNDRAVAEITNHIQAKRCGCEVNNPQGSCCLKNVKSVSPINH